MRVYKVEIRIENLSSAEENSPGNVYTGFTLWEIYDPDPSSVMSYLSEANAGLYGAWYYSDQYWKLRNMEYYSI